MKIHISSIVVFAAFTLAACVGERPLAPIERQGAPPTSETGEKTDTSAKNGGSQRKWISITPFTALTRYDCPVPNGTKDAGTGTASASTRCYMPLDDRFSDAYTRLIIFGESAGDNAQGEGGADTIVRYQSRSSVARLFAGVHRTIGLTAKVNVGSFAATVPLVTIDHISNRTSGERFNRVIYHRAANYPLFLVRRDGSNAIVSAQIVAKASDEAQSDAAGLALKLVQNVANFVAPPASVLTTLTSQNTKNVATAIDQAVNQIFATTIDEEQWVDDDIRYWGTRVTFTFRIPKNDGDWTDMPDQPIGKWTIAFANPRPSIFSDYEICPPNVASSLLKRCGPDYATAAKAAAAEVSAEQVLAFRLVGNQSNVDTIQKYLLQQDWYQKDVTAMSSATAGSAGFKDGVSSFCRSIKALIAGLGLNAVDAGIVVVAAQKGLDLPAKIVEGMRSDRVNCGNA